MARVLFIQSSFYELNSFQILSAVLKNHGHETNVFSIALDTRANLQNIISSWKPHMLAFTITSFDYQSMLAFADEIKKISRRISIVCSAVPTRLSRLMNLYSIPAQIRSAFVKENRY
ncbi:MAG: hypothetical protein ABII23_03285 [bacterium]